MVTSVRLKGYLVLGAVFLLGAVLGGAASYGYSRHRMVERFRSEGPLFAAEHRERALVRKLDLNDAQQTSLHALFERQGNERKELAEAMLKDCGGELQSHQQRMDDEIRALLTPEQTQRFDQMLQRRNKRKQLGHH